MLSTILPLCPFGPLLNLNAITDEHKQGSLSSPLDSRVQCGNWLGDTLVLLRHVALIAVFLLSMFSVSSLVPLHTDSTTGRRCLVPPLPCSRSGKPSSLSTYAYEAVTWRALQEISVLPPNIRIPVRFGWFAIDWFLRFCTKWCQLVIQHFSMRRRDLLRTSRYMLDTVRFHSPLHMCAPPPAEGSKSYFVINSRTENPRRRSVSTTGTSMGNF